MAIFSKSKVIILSIILTVIIFLGLDIFFIKLVRNFYSSKFYSEDFYSKMSLTNPSDSNLKNNNFKLQLNQNKLYSNKYNEKSNNDWEICVPKINLRAKIREGTSGKVINKTVGHFENTSILEGNVGLAAHNRGKGCNYFQRIGELKKRRRDLL